MSFLTSDSKPEPILAEAGQEVMPGARLVPHITIQAFCERSQTAQLVETAIHDRRMSKVALTTHNGGIDAAIETYRTNPTPNLIIVETSHQADQLLHGLERLAEVCDAATRLIVLGHVNDVLLYRELLRSGVSEYVVLPAEPATLVSAITELFVGQDAKPIGRTVGFVGAKGGAGASTIAHNVAWAVAQMVKQDVLILDMDLAFGTAGLDFNQDPPHGIADALSNGPKIDQTMLERLMSKAAPHINLLAAPVSLDTPLDFGERDFEQVVELSQNNVPVVILDIPHGWTGWIRHTLSTIDEIVIVAEPDLASLRNAKNLADTLKALRPSESQPMLLLNKQGVPRRPEIAANEFASSVDCRLLGTIGFDAALFGSAANNGQMIAEVSGSHKVNDVFKMIGLHVTGRSMVEASGRAKGFSLSSLFSKRQRA